MADLVTTQAQHDAICDYVRNEVLAGKVPWDVRLEKQALLEDLYAREDRNMDWKEDYRQLLELLKAPNL